MATWQPSALSRSALRLDPSSPFRRLTRSQEEFATYINGWELKRPSTASAGPDFVMRVSSRLLFRLELSARGGEVLFLLCRDLRIFEVKLLDRLDDRRGDDKAGEPLVVRGDNEPRRVFRRRRLTSAPCGTG